MSSKYSQRIIHNEDCMLGNYTLATHYIDIAYTSSSNNPFKDIKLDLFASKNKITPET